MYYTKHSVETSREEEKGARAHTKPTHHSIIRIQSAEVLKNYVRRVRISGQWILLFPNVFRCCSFVVVILSLLLCLALELNCVTHITCCGITSWERGKEIHWFMWCEIQVDPWIWIYTHCPMHKNMKNSCLLVQYPCILLKMKTNHREKRNVYS